MKRLSICLSLCAVSLLSLASCGAPNEAIVKIDDPVESTRITIHTDLQQGLIDAEEPDRYIANHELELTSFSNSAPKSTTFTISETKDKDVKAKSYEVIVSENKDLSDSWTFSSGSTSIDVYNLRLDTTYYLQAKSNYSGISFTSEIYSFKTEDSIIRNINVEGVENVRDIGGYVTESGKKMKQGLIYRTAQFNYDHSDDTAIKSEPTAKGLNTLLNELKIKTDIDVREKSNKQGKDETIGITSSPLGNSVNYKYLPLRFGGSNIYTVAQNKDNIKEFFNICADINNYPIAFHCVRGTDRTGALAWLLEALCGVEETDLYRDYLFSNFANIGGSTIRMKNIDGFSFYPHGIEESSGDTMSEKAMNYLINTVGVSQTTLTAIKDILLEK